MFKKATKKQAKLRFTFDGPAGSGKTYSSLVLAKALGGRTALIDTEHGSASKYANLFEFDTVALAEFSLETYIKTIGAAKAAGYEVLIIDSLSHAWTGKGGALEQVDRSSGNSKFTSGWRTVTPLHNALIDAMLAYPGHVIVTMRTKMEYVLEKDPKSGKEVPRKVGMAPVQREGMEYEFDVVCDLGLDGSVTISKTRCPDLSGSAGLLKHSEVTGLGETLKKWLSDGVPEPVPTPVIGTPAVGAPPVKEQVEIAMGEAQTRKDLEAVIPRIRALPKAEQDSLRALYMKRLTEVAP